VDVGGSGTGAVADRWRRVSVRLTRLALADAVAHDDCEVCNQQCTGSYDLNCNNVHGLSPSLQAFARYVLVYSVRAVYGLPAAAIEFWRDAPPPYLGGLQYYRSAHTNVSK